MRSALLLLVVGGLAVAGGRPARADVPAGYKGTPFDPAVVGGPNLPENVHAEPITWWGQGIIYAVNYDMGGEGVAFHTEVHDTTQDGDGYRADRPTATMCRTSRAEQDIWYDYPISVGPAEGTGYGSPDERFYICSIRPGDWFSYTVDVNYAGTYSISTTISTGNGPLGGGGDGQVGLIMFADDVKVVDWKAVFPDYENKANLHNWKPYVSLAQVRLAKGRHVIKLQLPFKNQNLDQLLFEILDFDAGAAGTGGEAGNGGFVDSDAGFTGGVSGTTGSVGAAGTTGASGTTGGAGTWGAAGTGVPGAKGGGGCGCALGRVAAPEAALPTSAALIALGLVARARRRRRRR